jgi:hypothetical protein
LRRDRATGVGRGGGHKGGRLSGVWPSAAGPETAPGQGGPPHRAQVGGAADAHKSRRQPTKPGSECGAGARASRARPGDAAMSDETRAGAAREPAGWLPKAMPCVFKPSGVSRGQCCWRAVVAGRDGAGRGPPPWRPSGPTSGGRAERALRCARASNARRSRGARGLRAPKPRGARKKAPAAKGPKRPGARPPVGRGRPGRRGRAQRPALPPTRGNQHPHKEACIPTAAEAAASWVASIGFQRAAPCLCPVPPCVRTPARRGEAGRVEELERAPRRRGRLAWRGG